MKHTLHIGTYTDATSRGIYAATFDDTTGAISTPVLAARMDNPSWIESVAGTRTTYAVSESGSTLHAFRRATSGMLTKLNSQRVGNNAGPCHILIDPSRRVALVSNYGGGSVAAVPIRKDGSLGARTALIQHTGSGPHANQRAPHAHCATLTPDRKTALISDLGIDRVVAYELDPARGSLTPRASESAALAPGSGPRHAVFSPDGRQLYVANELTSTVSVFTYDAAARTFTHRQTISTLPAGFTDASYVAEIAVHPNGRFVYVSNRGHESIAMLERIVDTGTLIQRTFTPCGGSWPRHLVLSPDARWMLVSNQKSDGVIVFRVDGATGQVEPTAQKATLSHPVCVAFSAA